MIRSGESTEPRQAAVGGRRRLRLAAGWVALGLVAPALLGGCGSADTLSGMFGDEPEQPTTVATPPEAQGDQPFPNLGSVPEEPPQTSSAEERAKLQEGLTADRANAEYTDEKLGKPATSATPAAPAPPAQTQAALPAAPEPAPAPEPAAGTVASQPQPPSPTPEPQPAPPPATAAQPVPAAPPPSPEPVPQSVPSVAQAQVLENGSVIVNPDAVLGGGPPSTSRLLPSGESRPVALIFFRHGSAGLARADVAVLREVVRLHKERGGLIRLIGHASQGPTSRNVAQQKLANFNISLARANAVARELVRLGVRSDRIQVAAAGAQQPLYYETQPTGEAGNRRVEIYLDY